MPNMPRERAVGYLNPLKDKQGTQIVNSKKERKWELIVSLPKHRVQSNSKRPRKTKVFWGSKRKAEEALRRFEAEINEELNKRSVPITPGVITDTANITFGEYVQRWIEMQKKLKSDKIRTWETYEGYAKNHIMPAIGYIKLKDVTVFHVSSYLDMKLGEEKKNRKGKISASTVNKHLAIIRGALEDAAKKNIISYNPGRLVKNASPEHASNDISYINCLDRNDLGELLEKLHRLYQLRNCSNKDKKDREIINILKSLGFTEQEIASPKILTKFATTTLYPVTFLAAHTGMRLSEILALTWPDIDFNKRLVYINKSSHYSGEGHIAKSTKENRPKVPVEIGDEVVEFLKHHKKEQTKHRLKYKGTYHDNNLVFSRNNGQHLYNDTVGKEFSRFAKKNGYNITFHGLRHTHVTLLMQAGYPVGYVSARVGHQKPSTTTDIYWHVDRAENKGLGAAFQDILKDNIKPEKSLEVAEEESASIVGRE